MPWTYGKNTCPSRYTFFGKGCKRILFRGLERATWTGYSNSKNRPLTLFEKEYYDPPPAYRRRPEITRMEAQTASARGYLKLPGRHPFPAAGGQRKGTSLRMSLSFGTPEGIRTSDLPLRREVFGMNPRVPQYPYTFCCAELPNCGLEHCVFCIYSCGNSHHLFHFAKVSKKLAKPQISKRLAEQHSVQDIIIAHEMACSPDIVSLLCPFTFLEKAVIIW